MRTGSRNIIVNVGDKTTQALLAVVKDYHYPDYGDLWYDAKRGAVWFSVGDGFEEGNEFKKRFEAVPGIRKVVVEAEHSPTSGDGDDGNNWVELT